MRYNCGYDTGISNIATGVQVGAATLSGIADYLNARTNGADSGTAARFGIYTGMTSIGNALLGNAVDRYTHSYAGTIMSGFANNLNNPFMGTSLMMGTAMMAAPGPMLNAMYGTPMMFGSMWGAPMMFGGVMPTFGHFYCQC